MSELMDTREEVAFDPEKVERVDPGKYGKYNYVRSEYYDQLLAANREQKAEIERLKGRMDFWQTMFYESEQDVCGCNIVDDPDLYHVCESHATNQKRARAYDEVIGLAERSEKAEAELASLRASAGEKPEDAYARGFDAGYERARAQATGRATLATRRYVAPPTLPTEEK